MNAKLRKIGKNDGRSKDQKKMSLGMQFRSILELFSAHFGFQMPPEPVPKRDRLFWPKKREAKKHPKSDSRGSFPSLTLQTSAPRPPLGGRGVKTYNQHPGSLTRPWAKGPANFKIILLLHHVQIILNKNYSPPPR